MQDDENDEKKIDIKGTLESFIEEEKPELSQEEAIKAYKGENIRKKKTSNSGDDDTDEENEDEEHLKRLKKELLESLERVNVLAKKIFEEKETLKNIKVKEAGRNGKKQVIEQNRDSLNNIQERSREE